MKKQQGFTLIELIVVIVILGILAATAAPKFLDLTVDAHNNAALGVAGSIASGTAFNFGSKLLNNASAVTVNQANVCTAATLQQFVDGVTLLDAASAPADSTQFQLGGTGDCSGTNTTVTCTVTPQGTGVTAQNATVTCAR